MAGTLQQDNLVEASMWQENDAGQDFQLMEQHKVTAAAFPAVLLIAVVPNSLR